MKTAEAILNENYYGRQDPDLDFDGLVDIINQARSECLQEAAEKAKSEWVRYGTQMGHQVEKQSILNLIKELK